MDTTISSTANLALQRLMTWLSPAFPVGAFAYSAGLETAISNGTVTSDLHLHQWIQGALTSGSGKSDAILVAEAHRGESDSAKLAQVAEFCCALTPAAQRIAELHTLGRSFIEAAKAWPTPALDNLPTPCPYPVAVGAIAGGHNIPLVSTLTAFLTAYAHSQISVAVRLVPIGQTEGLHVLAELEPTIAGIAAEASTKTLNDIGTISYAADIAAMQHETQRSRVFRS